MLVSFVFTAHIMSGHQEKNAPASEGRSDENGSNSRSAGHNEKDSKTKTSPDNKCAAVDANYTSEFLKAEAGIPNISSYLNAFRQMRDCHSPPKKKDEK